MRILITGGAGFIGANLARQALRRGHDICILDDLSNGFVANVEGLDLEFNKGSVADLETATKAARGRDAVIHLGALGSVPRSIANPLATHHANATGTLTILEAARAVGVGHVVSASSSSVYGSNPALPKQERQWVRPVSPYAVSKLATEQYTLAFQDSYGLDTLAFRFFNVYGPRQSVGHAYAAVIPIFIEALIAGRPLPINGDGTQSRDFTFVDTVCQVLLDAVERRVTHPEPVNLAFGARVSLNSIIERLERLVGHHIAVEHKLNRPGDVPHSEADNSTLVSLFPAVSPVAIDEGLERTLQWFQSTL